MSPEKVQKVEIPGYCTGPLAINSWTFKGLVSSYRQTQKPLKCVLSSTFQSEFFFLGGKSIALFPEI